MQNKRTVEVFEIGDEALDAAVFEIVGHEISNAEIHKLLEESGHYVATNEERIKRTDDNAYISPIVGDRWVSGRTHLQTMKKAFVLAKTTKTKKTH